MELATRGCDPDAARLLHQVIHRLAYSDSTASGWLKGAHARFRYRSKLKLILSASKPTLELDYRDTADEKTGPSKCCRWTCGPPARSRHRGRAINTDITNHSPELEPFVQCLKRLFHGWDWRHRPDEFPVGPASLRSLSKGIQATARPRLPSRTRRRRQHHGRTSRWGREPPVASRNSESKLLI